jgi:hypothetical protein
VHHEVEEGAIIEKGQWVNGFTGVESLQRLVGRIGTMHPNRKFVVEEICDDRSVTRCPLISARFDCSIILVFSPI